MKKLLTFILCFTFMMALPGCDSSTNSFSSTSTGNFKIYLIREKSPIPSYKPYEDTSWQDFVQNTKREEVFITDQDVTSYDWENQILTLSKPATERIKQRYQENFQGQKYLSLDVNRFILTLNDKPLYGGMFLFPASQIAANYPLIYISSDKYEAAGPTIPLEKVDILKLSIHPANLEPYRTGKMGRIKIASIKDFFANEGKLINDSYQSPYITLQKFPDIDSAKNIQIINLASLNGLKNVPDLSISDLKEIFHSAKIIPKDNVRLSPQWSNTYNVRYNGYFDTRDGIYNFQLGYNPDPLGILTLPDGSMGAFSYKIPENLK